MKRILSLLTVVTLTTSGTTSVISCSNQKNNQQKVNEIKNEITKKNITVPAGTNPDTSNPNTITAMKNALVKEDPSIKTSINDITFSKTTLKPGVAVEVDAIITVGSDTSKVPLQVTLELTDQQKANAIKNKIKNKDINVPSGTDPDTSNSNTIKAIKASLQTANPTLTEDDLTKITFSKTTLKPGVAVEVDAIITVGSDTSKVPLKVTLEWTDQQKANAIKNKIKNKDINVPSETKPNTSNSNTVTAMKNALVKKNPSIQNDLKYITFSKTTLKPGVAVEVDAIITVGSNHTSLVLQVTLESTDKHKVDIIANKIRNTNINVPIGTEPDTSIPRTITEIKTALIGANPTLSNDDLTKITFSKTTLKPGVEIPVVATITVGTAKDIKVLQVTLTATPQQEVTLIKNKIKNTDIYLPHKLDFHVSDNITAKRILHELKWLNPALTDKDLTRIGLDKNVKLAYGKFIPVQATIRVQHVTATIMLNVWLRYSDTYRVHVIKHKLANIMNNPKINITIPKSEDKQVASNYIQIRKALQKIDPTLSNDDLKNVWFEKETPTAHFEPGHKLNVQVDIIIGTINDTSIHLWITMEA